MASVHSINAGATSSAVPLGAAQAQERSVFGPAARPARGENALPAGMRSDDDDGELALVLREIADIMGARGAALTLHPVDGGGPSLIDTDRGGRLSGSHIDRLLDPRLTSRRDGDMRSCRWIDGDGEARSRDILLLPVERIAGHSRLLIGVFFDRITDEQRRAAETLYLERRPFAIGYFRLWQLERMHRRRADVLETALDLADLGVLTLDRFGGIVFANQAARELLDAGDGLRRKRESIQATELGDSVRLQVALEHVISANEAMKPGHQPSWRAPFVRLHRTSAPPLILAAIAARKRATEPSDVAAIVYVADPARENEKFLQPLFRLFNLSTSEARLAGLLAHGATLAKAAEAMRVKEQTARGYLKQIFIKTDTNRQGELVHRLLSSLLKINRIVEPEFFDG